MQYGLQNDDYFLKSISFTYVIYKYSTTRDIFKSFINYPDTRKINDRLIIKRTSKRYTLGKKKNDRRMIV